MAGKIFDLFNEESIRELQDKSPHGGRLRFPPKFSKHNPIYRKDRNRSICHMRIQGYSLNEIAEKHNICISTVKEILKENGLTHKKERLDIIEEIKIMIGLGMKRRQIAKKLGISHTTLYNHMKKRG